MSKIVNSNINNVMFRGGECDALYHGANLIWRRGIVEEDDRTNILNVTSTGSTYTFNYNIGTKNIYNSNQDYEIDIDNWEYGYNIFGSSEEAKAISVINKFPSTKNLITMSTMFNNCINLTYLPSFEITNKCRSISSIFSWCYNLKSIDTSKWDLSGITEMGMDDAFMECLVENIDLSKCGTPNIITLNQTFNVCGAKKIDISNLDTSNVTSMVSLFTQSPYLEEINLGEKWDMSKVTNHTNFVAYCRNLTTIKGKITNLGLKSNSVLGTQYCPFTNESAMVLINGLAKINSRQTITFSKETYSTLTDEQKKIATDKGWTVASA